MKFITTSSLVMMIYLHIMLLNSDHNAIQSIFADAQTTTSSSSYPCNPASYCNSKSLLCKSSQEIDLIIKNGGSPVDSNDYGRGICTEAYNWKCNSDGRDCKKYDYSLDQAWKLCRESMIPPNGPKYYPGLFVEACRNGEYTCNNGFCSVNIDECKKNGGVRYSNMRCDKSYCDKNTQITSNDYCKTESLTITPSLECGNQTQSTIQSCCPTSSKQQCRYLQLQSNGKEIFRQCGDASQDPSGDSITKYPTSGLTISFNQKKQESKECCCKLSCDCFGDPHCTNFFGQQQTSKVSSGSFTMFKTNDISIDAYMGAPQGILTKLIIKSSADPRTFQLNADQCNNATHNWIDVTTGQFIDKITLPSNWESVFPVKSTSVSAFIHPPAYHVRDSKSQILFEIKCQPFLWPASKKYSKSNRFDVVITAWRDKVADKNSGSLCCPTEQQNLDWFLKTGAEGFCVDSSANPLPGGQTNSRVLKDASTSTSTSLIVSDENIKNKNIWIMSDEDNASALENDVRSLVATTATTTEICEEYLNLAKKDQSSIFTNLKECLATIDDFGIESIAALIELLRASTKECVDNIHDPRLPGPTGLTGCQEGIVLEVKLNGGKDEWIPIQSFPANLPYCNNKIEFFFEGIQVSPSRYLNSSDSFRLTQCTPDPTTCGSCNSLRSIEDYGFNYIYECKSYKAMRNFLKSDLLQSMKRGKISCGFQYFGTSDPTDCAKAALEAFANRL